MSVIIFYVAHCRTCKAQWSVKSKAGVPVDATGCNFCGAPKSQIYLEREEG